MSEFTRFSGPVDTRHIPSVDNGWWPPKQLELVRELVYHVGTYPSLNVITVRRGYVTDGATVPFGMRWIIRPIGWHLAACILHDYLVSDLRFKYTREQSIRIFAEALGVLAKTRRQRLQRHLMILAVKAGSPRDGWRGY